MAVSFREDELEATCPDGITKYWVDDPSTFPGGVSRVDWAWDEPGRHFLCEFKDPECRGALAHNAGAAALMRAELAGPAYPGALARKASNTVQHHTPTAQAPVRVYILIVAVTALTAAEMAAASLVIQRELGRAGSPMPAIVVNISGWNTQLAPRTMVRI